MPKTHKIILGMVLCLLNTQVWAEERPQWELGVALGSASLPHYMGSDERYQFTFPVPYVLYRSDKIQLDRDQVKYQLLGLKDIRLDTSLGLGLPVHSNNKARQGMPDIAFNVQAGPRLSWNFFNSQHSHWYARLPIRAAMDVKGHFFGWLSEPGIHGKLEPSPQLRLYLDLGALFVSQKYNAVFYAVPQQYSTVSRPSYHASAGLHSLTSRVIVNWEINKRWNSFATLRYRNLALGRIANSPLVKTPNYVSMSMGISWSFYQSDRHVDIADEF